MTSSLVGSEMCIRDSVTWHEGRKLHTLGVSVAVTPPRVRGPSRTAPPVSYTHLTLPTICSV
eukprot:11395932-Prorocentrum_lima.AAC.1